MLPHRATGYRDMIKTEQIFSKFKPETKRIRQTTGDEMRSKKSTHEQENANLLRSMRPIKLKVARVLSKLLIADPRVTFHV